MKTVDELKEILYSKSLPASTEAGVILKWFGDMLDQDLFEQLLDPLKMFLTPAVVEIFEIDLNRISSATMVAIVSACFFFKIENYRLFYDKVYQKLKLDLGEDRASANLSGLKPK